VYVEDLYIGNALVNYTLSLRDSGQILDFFSPCNFSAETPKAIIEREIVSIPSIYLGSWDGSLGVTIEDLKKRYDLDTVGSCRGAAESLPSSQATKDVSRTFHGRRFVSCLPCVTCQVLRH